MITEKDIKEYMRTNFKSSWERIHFMQILNSELIEEDSKRDDIDREKRIERAQRKREREEAQGETMKKIVKPGMVVKCRGTKDGQGIREVMEVNDFGIVARKITMERREYYRDSYITEHYWNKVIKILDIEVVK